MYTNPAGIRDHEVKVRFNEAEEKLIESIVDYLGSQKAVFVREMALEHIKSLIEQGHLKIKNL